MFVFHDGVEGLRGRKVEGWKGRKAEGLRAEAIGSFGIKKKGYFCHQMYQNGLSGIKIFRQVF
jgi:hypothetical protein